MLLYGNPGTGKTTTVNVFINTYVDTVIANNEVSNLYIKQELYKNILRLNASVYRNTQDLLTTITKFSNSKHMFCSINCIKFIILDEIDYMTVQGQKCLINLMKRNTDVIFICMCNYLSKLNREIVGYFLTFNYNCFGSIVKQFIVAEDVDGPLINKTTQTLLSYILSITDIREYNNEKQRMTMVSIDDQIYCLSIINKKIHDITDCITNDIPIDYSYILSPSTFKYLEQCLGITSDKLITIVIQQTVELFLNNPVLKVHNYRYKTFIENAYFSKH